MSNPNKPKRQPKTIKFGGKNFILHTPFRWIDEKVGICTGPLYRLTRNGTETLYMPDAGYLYAGMKLSVMHALTFTSKK